LNHGLLSDTTMAGVAPPMGGELVETAMKSRIPQNTPA
jgi:hypothetical protein